MLGNTLNEPSRFMTQNWVEISDESRGMYNSNNQIRFKTSMLKKKLCGHSDALIVEKGTITITRGPNDATEANKRPGKRNKGVIFENCVAFIECTIKTSNIKIDHVKYLLTKIFL